MVIILESKLVLFLLLLSGVINLILVYLLVALQRKIHHLPKKLSDLKRENQGLQNQITSLIEKSVGRKAKSDVPKEKVFDSKEAPNYDAPSPTQEWNKQYFHTSSGHTKSDNHEEIVPEDTEANNIIYLPFPDNECTFFAPDASHNPKEDTFYKIDNEELLLHDNISSEEMKTAMNFAENHIKRVCLIMNARETGHSRIVLIEPGKIKLRENDYYVIEKIKVKYV